MTPEIRFTGIVKLIEKYGVDIVVYGHLHGKIPQGAAGKQAAKIDRQKDPDMLPAADIADFFRLNVLQGSHGDGT